MKKIALIGLLWFASLLPTAWAATEIEGERLEVPLTLQGETLHLDAMLYKPPGGGPFPALVITHGSPRKAAERENVTADTYFVRNAKLFAQLDLVVLFVVRRGFGISEGTYSEYNRGPDDRRLYAKDGLEAAKDLGAAVQYLREQPFVDKRRIVLLGQSTGGHSVLAAGSLNLPGVAGVINFAGGRGSTGPDEVQDEDSLVESFGVFGKTFRVPTLWLYSENDHYFGPELARRFLSAFQAGGAKVEFVLLPPYGDDGHSSFVRAPENWLDAVVEFLQKIGIVSPLSSRLGSAA